MGIKCSSFGNWSLRLDSVLFHLTSTFYCFKFFCFRYLAHDMEEDDEELKQKIFPWAPGTNWHKIFSSFISRRDNIWKRMNYRSAVSKLTCQEVSI